MAYRKSPQREGKDTSVIWYADGTDFWNTQQMIIPLESDGNVDYMKYKEWLDEGNTPEEWEDKE